MVCNNPKVPHYLPRDLVSTSHVDAYSLHQLGTAHTNPGLPDVLVSAIQLLWMLQQRLIPSVLQLSQCYVDILNNLVGDQTYKKRVATVSFVLINAVVFMIHFAVCIQPAVVTVKQYSKRYGKQHEGVVNEPSCHAISKGTGIHVHCNPLEDSVIELDCSVGNAEERDTTNEPSSPVDYKHEAIPEGRPSTSALKSIAEEEAAMTPAAQDIDSSTLFYI